MLWIIALVTSAIFIVFLVGAASIDEGPREERLGDDEDFLFFAEEDTEDDS